MLLLFLLTANNTLGKPGVCWWEGDPLHPWIRGKPGNYGLPVTGAAGMTTIVPLGPGYPGPRANASPAHVQSSSSVGLGLCSPTLRPHSDTSRE